MTGAFLHRGRLDRHQFVEPILGENEAAGMLRQMPGRADKLPRQIERQAQAAVGQVEIELGGKLGIDAFIAPTPDLRGQGAGDVFGEAERLADLAHRRRACFPVPTWRCRSRGAQRRG